MWVRVWEEFDTSLIKEKPARPLALARVPQAPSVTTFNHGAALATMNATTPVVQALYEFANATNNATNATSADDCRSWGASSPVMTEVTCDEESIQVLRSILLTCAAVFVVVLAVLCTLVLALMLQVRKLGVLIRSLRAATGSAAVEVCSGLLTTAPELRSSFQSKAKKSNKKKTAKFTDTEDTACSTPRDVDEEEL